MYQSRDKKPSATRAAARTGQSGRTGAPRPVGSDVRQGGIHISAASAGLQTKLTVSQPGDRHEREADSVAEQVMRMPRPSATGAAGGVMRAESGPGATAGTAPGIVNDVVNSSGAPLDASAREYMEPRFGRDFGNVRVHTDARAAESARSVSALAYTVGNNIVFGEGQYAPSTGQGGRLLAHELTHVVQQTGAGPSTSTLQRQPDPKDKEMRDLAASIAAIVNASMSGYNFKMKWSAIQSQIESPVATAPKAMSSYSGIYAKEIVDKLNGFTADQRKTIAGYVQSTVIESVTGKTGDEITAEYNSLDSFVRNNIEPGGGKSQFAGYVGARTALMAKFGSVAKINEYYGALVSADFPSSKVKGSGMKVHANLRAKLQKAVTLMTTKKTGTQTWLQIAEAGISSVGGFNIRENRNNTSSLSFHSFGWAIDIDATKNPNISEKEFPSKLVTGVSGVDVYAGDDVKAIRTGGTADELLAHAQAMRNASDTFKGTFADVPSFKTGFTKYLQGQGLVIDTTQADDLYTMLTQVSTKKKATVTVKSVETWLSDANARNAPKSQGSPTAATTPAPWPKAAEVAGFLVQWYNLFVKSGGQSGKLVPSTTTGTSASVAAQGFINLPAEVITALTSSDGADLKWLGGVADETKDFMHFELKKADQPAITKDTPAVTPPSTGK